MRKKILLSAAIFFSVLQLSAQLQKNQIYVGVTGEKRFGQTTSIGVRPSLSFGLNNHSEVGVYFDYTKFKEPNDPNFKVNAQVYAAGFFYNYYQYLGRSEKWGLFLTAGASLGRVRISQVILGNATISRYNESRFSISPGIFFKPSKNILLHLDLGNVAGLHNRYESFHVTSNLGKQINIGIKFGLGDTQKKKAIAKTVY
jgi:hypothetical protein